MVIPSIVSEYLSRYEFLLMYFWLTMSLYALIRPLRCFLQVSSQFYIGSEYIYQFSSMYSIPLFFLEETIFYLHVLFYYLSFSLLILWRCLCWRSRTCKRLLAQQFPGKNGRVIFSLLSQNLKQNCFREFKLFLLYIVIFHILKCFET
jgi:hypothetical protein